MRVRYRVRGIFLLLLLAVSGGAESVELTLDQAIEIAVDRSSRSEIIEGDLEVAEQNYFAERINFYLPEISVNGSLPAYNVAESFRFFGGGDEKNLIKTTDLDFNTNIKLNQSLITGGNLTVTGNIWNREAEYPLSGADVTEKSSQGVFDFELEQPLLKPSEQKYELKNKKDDLELARLTHVEDLAALKNEVTEAYFGVLQTEVKKQVTRAKLEAATLTLGIDSAKFDDGIISEEARLESTSAKLDAELEQIDIDNENLTKSRELAIVLDLDPSEAFAVVIPDPGGHLGDETRRAVVNRWEASVGVQKGLYEYSKAQRQADYAASGHGLTGNLKATYSLGRGDVEVDGLEQTNNTDSWGVSLNFSYPIWDGGSSGAAVKAARLTAKKSQLEYERARRSARAEMVDLVNRLDISFRKLNILTQQIEVTKNKRKIALFRLEDGQISRRDFLETEVAYLEAQDKYLDELKNYLIDKIELQSRYSG
ncbi:MAG: TolC family protein [candidate division Zixibacteria bacterium]|nr:TolC family protein [candidate division Zixibacteria bacterium]